MMAVHAAAYRVATEVASWVSAQPGDWDPDSGKDPEWGKAAPAGLLIWLFLGVMLFLLIKSMNKHLRKARANLSGDADLARDDVEAASGDESAMTSPAAVDDPDAAADAVADGSDTRSV